MLAYHGNIKPIELPHEYKGETRPLFAQISIESSNHIITGMLPKNCNRYSGMKAFATRENKLQKHIVIPICNTEYNYIYDLPKQLTDIIR